MIPSLARRLLLLAALPLLSGCGVLEPDPDPSVEVRVLYVGPEMADCVGVAPQRCLLVRENPAEAWRLFYGGIEGFTHEPGFRYTLFVEISEISDPPADGSSLRYRLLDVVSRERVDAAQAAWSPMST